MTLKTEDSLGIEEIKLEDLNALEPVANSSPWYNMNAGQEHYRLLRYISPHYDLVYDVGTYHGFSALALSGAKKVITCDIEDSQTVILPENVAYREGDCLNDPELLKAELILLDTFHDGKFESDFLNFLDQSKYKGILIMDDIHLNNEMQRIWHEVQLNHKAFDITHIGHYTGTGLVYYE